MSRRGLEDEARARRKDVSVFVDAILGFCSVSSKSVVLFEECGVRRDSVVLCGCNSGVHNS